MIMKLYKILLHPLLFLLSIGNTASAESLIGTRHVYQKQTVKSKHQRKRPKKKKTRQQQTSQNKERGQACYYSKQATCRRTASGRVLDSEALVCAHKKHPFGSILRVTNLANGKTVEVEVVDRGPFGKGKIVDLSWEAARQLGILSRGVEYVTVEKIK